MPRLPNPSQIQGGELSQRLEKHIQDLEEHIEWQGGCIQEMQADIEALRELYGFAVCNCSSCAPHGEWVFGGMGLRGYCDREKHIQHLAEHMGQLQEHAEQQRDYVQEMQTKMQALGELYGFEVPSLTACYLPVC
jgi:hypothetical protein